MKSVSVSFKTLHIFLHIFSTTKFPTKDLLVSSKEDFRMNQDLLRKKTKMNIVSALDKTKTSTGEDTNDRGWNLR